MKVNTDGVLLGAWADVQHASRMLDIGTGTGVIAIMLGQRSEQAHITAVEIDSDACEQAIENIASTPWASRIEVVNIPIQDFAKTTREQFDLIVSNPPFFTGGTFSSNQQKASVRHTVKLPHSDLLSSVRSLLSPDGRFCVILPLIEGLRFVEVAATYHLHCTKMTEVLPRANKPVERLLLQFETKNHPREQGQVVIYEPESEQYTPPYVALTKDFYLNM